MMNIQQTKKLKDLYFTCINSSSIEYATYNIYITVDVSIATLAKYRGITVRESIVHIIVVVS